MSMAKALLRGGGNGGDGEAPILSPTHPNLLVMYTMDNITGPTLFDETANSFDGTITGAVAVAGQIGNALLYDGVDDFTVSALGSPRLENTGAVCFWLKPTEAGNAAFAFSYAAQANSVRYFLCLLDATTRKLQYQHRTPTQLDILDSSTTVPLNSYTHCVIQTTGTTIEMYLGGVKEGTLTTIAGGNNGSWFFDLDQPGTYTAELGRFKRLAATSFGGSFEEDQFRIFDRVLTQGEITSLATET